ncbi:MAG TPA: DHH family phosphoesterase, partial [Candidatus Nanoarchaeia archaeon]|nr:DHH family phosphoesterase [Candidatus Nanoarchaeia archaeon]
GLCSFLLLRRWLGRGTGAAVRSYPEVSEQYLGKIDYTKADGIVVLDRHALSLDIINGIKQRGLSIIWIDHHAVEDTKMQEESDFIYYFNSKFTLSKKNTYPVSFHMQKIANQKKDYWISLVGCISDCYLPSYHKEFAKKNPQMWAKKVKTAFDAYYKTLLGKIALYLNFSLKNSAMQVIQIQDFLIKCQRPEEILEENEGNPLIVHAAAMLKKCQDYLVDARATVKGNSLFFQYSGDTSMSAEISNALIYEFPEKFICVAFKKQGIVNISLRGDNVKQILEEILKYLGTGTGGGHRDAVGARIPRNKLEEFQELFREKTEKIKTFK